ncbi:MAG: tripartite tricarboxylate transporter substrate binding protein [Rhodoplanes sp.]|uniref:Bug family tripartite tricarboxylate transporter substrate binding protein n=1 Tax=Rhodoplanes sp. TaxID=1968906 RepID=UPI0017D533C8|nr:tripartite tricarboxylate transporter substrate binding protein [Rhodoplanes sp.]NVO16204.1 tripartite tricarboxylate transporter substrate binding protein [Rhodoplanes sp.]
MTLTRRRGLQLAGAALAAPALCLTARAETWPSKPIKAIVTLSAGSTIDIVARMTLDPLSRLIGQNIIVENRPGAGGTIAGATVARSDPDGYTVLINSSMHSATPVVYPKLAYDVARDLSAVAALGSSPNVIVVPPSAGYKTLQDFVAAAKRKPGGVTFGTAGVGSATHVSTERFRYAAGFPGVHVPFRGMPEALVEVMTGRVDFSCSSIAAALTFVRDGSLVALAVTTPKRCSALPDVPTTTELGYANSDYTFWTGMFMPAKTPRDIVEKMNAETQKALRTPGLAERLSQEGVDVMPITPAEFDALIRTEIANTFALVKATNINFN